MTAPASDTSAHGQGTVCPSCNRFVGAYDRCPYCGTGISKRIPLRTIKIAAMVIAIVGMLCLHIMAMYRDIPTKSIGSITPAMNFGYISVKGTVTQPMRFYRDGDTISGFGFGVEDDSGQLRVRGYRTVAETLHKNGLALRRGDTVKISGTLRIIEGDNISMLLQVPAHLELLDSSEAVTVSLDELANVEDGQNVQLSAHISRIMFPASKRAPYRISLKDDTGSASLVIWPSQFDEITGRDQLMEGTLVKVRAAKSSYRNTPQLQIGNPQDMVILASSTTDAVKDTVAPTDQKPVALGSLSSANKDSIVTVQGTIKQFNPQREGTRTPYVITLTDGNVEIPLVFWSDSYDTLKNPEAIAPGAVLSARVRVSEYRGRPQLVLTSPAELIVKTPASEGSVKPPTVKEKEPEKVKETGGETTQLRLLHSSNYALLSSIDSPKNYAGSMAINDIGTATLGTKVTIEGTVDSVRHPASAKSPYIITLSDKDSSIAVVMWEAAWKTLTTTPVTGSTFRVNGIVSEYMGSRQVRVSSGTFTGTSSSGSRQQFSQPSVQSLRSVELAEPGSRITVKAEVAKVVTPSHDRAPYRVTLKEGKDSVTMVIWKDTWEALPEYNQPKKGATLIVSGKISEYNDTRQIRVDSASTIERVK